MRFAAISLLLATAASAQLSSIAGSGMTPLQLGKYALGLVSSDCKSALSTAFSANSTTFQCLHLDALMPALNSTGPLIPYLDKYLSTACGAAPCNTSALNTTVAKVFSSCQSDLKKFGVSVPSDVVYEAVGLYPVARDVACLKTTNATTYANASIPLNSSQYNTTNGTFCLTDLATDLSAYLGVNLTSTTITSTILGGNSSALNMVKKLPPSAICTDCIIAGYDIVEEALPWVGNISIAPKVTLDTLVSKTCASSNVTISNNGTLPPTIHEGASNTTVTKINGTALQSVAGVKVASTSGAVTSKIASATSAAASATHAKRRFVPENDIFDQ